MRSTYEEDATSLIKSSTARVTTSDRAEMAKFQYPKCIMVVVAKSTEASLLSRTGADTAVFVDEKMKHENSTTTINNKMLPFRIVQIGAPRTGSSFQFELLKAIARLKNPTVVGDESKVLFTHIPTNVDTNEVLTNIFEKTPSFIVKIHEDCPILKEYQNRGDISVFASSNIVSFATYVQHKDRLFACSMCEIERYQSFFGLTTNEVNTLKEYMGLNEKIRQCCGIQMSQYEIHRLNGCDMNGYIEKLSYLNCEKYNFDDIELKLKANPIPYHEDNNKLHWSKPGDCARYRMIISSGKTFNGNEFDGCYIGGSFAGKKKKDNKSNTNESHNNATFRENMRVDVGTSGRSRPMINNISHEKRRANDYDIEESKDSEDVAIVHVISLFKVELCQYPYCPFDQAQSVVIGSMQRAREKARTPVIFATATLPGDEDALPSNFLQFPLVRSTVSENENANVFTKKLPFIQDIFDETLKSNIAFEYMIYTNSDIILHENFYDIVQKQIKLGFDFFTINRQTISNNRNRDGKLYTASDLDEIFTQKTKTHPGTDCFIIKRSVLEKLNIGKMCLGASAVANMINLQAIYFAHKSTQFVSNALKATYHLGDDRSWKSEANLNTNKYNIFNAICGQQMRWVDVCIKVFFEEFNTTNRICTEEQNKERQDNKSQKNRRVQTNCCFLQGKVRRFVDKAYDMTNTKWCETHSLGGYVSNH